MAPHTWWRDPVLHFVLAGAAMFAVDRWRSPPGDARTVVISRAFVRGVGDELARRDGHRPDEASLRAAVQSFVDEELLYREALRLGLDRGDVIVRRRLVQKMEFLAEDDLGPDPDDAALGRWVADHAERYALPMRVRFRDVFIDRGRHPNDADAVARSLAERLAAGDDPARLGDPSTRAGAQDTSVDRVAAELGPDVATTLRTAGLGRWSAPVASRFGLHLVRVEVRDEARLPSIAEVRGRALQDWREERVAAARRSALARLRARYTVRVEGGP